MAKPVKIYRIRRKSDGLFSGGGMNPKFTKRGKIWQGLGPLKNHLNCLLKMHLEALRIKRNEKYWGHSEYQNYNESFVYENCELIEYVLEEKENQVTNLMDIF